MIMRIMGAVGLLGAEGCRDVGIYRDGLLMVSDS